MLSVMPEQLPGATGTAEDIAGHREAREGIQERWRLVEATGWIAIS